MDSRGCRRHGATSPVQGDASCLDSAAPGPTTSTHDAIDPLDTDSDNDDDDDDDEEGAEQEPGCRGAMTSSCEKGHGADDVEPAHPPGRTPTRRSHETPHQLRLSASKALARAASHLTTRSLPEPPPPPDGGFQAWTQVACGWLVILTTWGYVNAFGAFQTYYTEALAPLPPSIISWIGSVQVCLTFCVGAFSGRLLDAGLFIPTFAIGAILQLLGIFLMSVCTQFWQLMLTQGVLTGLGGGLIFTPSMGLIATYFQKRRAVAVGLTTSGNSIGGLLYPLIVRQLIPAVGFAWTTRVIAFVNLACLAIAIAFMRPRLPPRTSGPLIDPSALREPVYVLIVSGLFFMLWAVYYSFYYIASFGTQMLHMPYSTASVTVILINAAGLPMRLITPFLAARFGCINLVIPAAFMVALVGACWLAVADVPGYFAFASVYGAVNGAFHCLMPTVIASASPRLDMVGTRLGMAFAVVGIAALTGPPLGGALQSAMGGSFTGASIWAAASAFVCVALLSTARGVLTGWKLRAVC